MAAPRAAPFAGFGSTQFSGKDGSIYGQNPANKAEQLIYNPQTKTYGESDPFTKQVVGGFPTLAAAQAAFSQKYGNPGGGIATAPGGNPGNPTAAPGGGGGVAPPAPSLLQKPSTLASLFPQGLPQATAAQVGSIPTITPSTIAPAPSTSGITSSILAAMAPEFTQQNRGLDETLANAGIVGGSSTGAHGALDLQQQQQALSQMSPYIMQGFQMQQAGNEFNAGQTQQAATTNQGVNLGAQEYNAGAQTGVNQYNTSNLLNANQFDVGQSNEMSKYLAGMQQQDYLTQLGMQGNLIDAGAAGQTGAYQSIYQQPTPPNYTGLGAAFAPPASPATHQNISTPYVPKSTYSPNYNDPYSPGN